MPVPAPELVQPVAVPVPAAAGRAPVVTADRPEAAVLASAEPDGRGDEAAAAPAPKTTARRAAPRATRSRKAAESADEGASPGGPTAEEDESFGEQRAGADGDGSAA